MLQEESKLGNSAIKLAVFGHGGGGGWTPSLGTSHRHERMILISLTQSILAKGRPLLGDECTSLFQWGGGLAPARMQWQQGPSRGLDFHFGEEHETQKKEWDFPTISSCYFLQGEVQLLGSLGDGPSSSEKEGRWTISEVCYLMEEHGDDSQIRTPTDLVREGMHCLTFWSSMKHKLHRSSLFREEFGVSLSAGESSCCRSGEEGGSGRTSVLLEGPRRQIWMQTQLSGS